jgi:DNA-binding NtrC family response regulator
MGGERILIVDDEEMNREFLQELLGQQGYDVKTAADGMAALELLKSEAFHVVLSDLKMPRMSGIELLRQLKEVAPSSVGIIMTAYAAVDTAVEAVKAGAYHEKMQDIFEMVEKVADSDSTVLIYGESGTGKELIARALHYNSYRQDKPLVPINCGAIPAELLESELFGFEKGAFTGATALRVGRFELANGGTVFLDEIGEMSPMLQVKLLRVLQQREFERIGGTKTIKVDVRILAATNKDLEELVAKNQFREDLYYRLSVIPIHMPPLRERTSDIPLLVAHFIARFNAEKKRHIEGITPEAMGRLLHYHWPGNVRELENLIERVTILKGRGFIAPADLPEKLAPALANGTVPEVEIPNSGLDFDDAVQAFERQLLTKALERTQGVKSKAAELLNMNRTTLVEKVKKLRLEA